MTAEKRPLDRDVEPVRPGRPDRGAEGRVAGGPMSPGGAGGRRTGRIVVVGDALLDRDLVGTVDRVASDAPVPVLAETTVHERPGGAGLAAVLAAADGHEVTLVTAIGDDDAGRRLRELLAAEGVRVVGLGHRGATVEKIRMCAGNQVMLRLDRGDGKATAQPPARAALDALATAAAVVVSDYGRGVTAVAELRDALAAAARRVPVVWDPHPTGSGPVAGCRLMTPNEKELSAYHEATAGPVPSRLAALTATAGRLARMWRAHAVAVTLGADGALLTRHRSTPLLIPAPRRSTADPCGAGDRLATAAAAALAGGALTSEAVQTGVARASEFVAAGGALGRGPQPAGPAPAPEAAGSARRIASGVRDRGGVVVATGGCFDILHAGHIATLTAARELGDCLIVCVNSDASVARLKGPGRPLTSVGDRVRMLNALSCVDAVVVFDESTPVRVLERLRPDVWVKGGDYLLDDTGTGPALPEAEVVRRWGGQCVAVPYLSGYSTTGIIQAARTTPQSAEEYAHD